MPELDGQVHHDTHVIPMGNYVIEVGKSLIRSPSQVGNYKIVHTARELLATSERVRKRTTSAPAQLTAREAQIARLASDGLSNHEIAGQLFMSPRTVGYHLHKVFAKLAINSRNQVHGALANHGNRGPQQTR